MGKEIFKQTGVVHPEIADVTFQSFQIISHYLRDFVKEKTSKSPDITNIQLSLETSPSEGDSDSSTSNNSVIVEESEHGIISVKLNVITKIQRTVVSHDND